MTPDLDHRCSPTAYCIRHVPIQRNLYRIFVQGGLTLLFWRVLQGPLRLVVMSSPSPDVPHTVLAVLLNQEQGQRGGTVVLMTFVHTGHQAE